MVNLLKENAMLGSRFGQVEGKFVMLVITTSKVRGLIEPLIDRISDAENLLIQRRSYGQFLKSPDRMC